MVMSSLAPGAAATKYWNACEWLSSRTAGPQSPDGEFGERDVSVRQVREGLEGLAQSPPLLDAQGFTPRRVVDDAVEARELAEPLVFERVGGRDVRRREAVNSELRAEQREDRAGRGDGQLVAVYAPEAVAAELLQHGARQASRRSRVARALPQYAPQTTHADFEK